VVVAFSIGIFGASGYTGVELLRLVAGHPGLEVVHAGADSNEGNLVADVAPGLAAEYRGLRFGAIDARSVEGVDLVFCCLPHGASAPLVAEMMGRVGHVVDLGADFRLRDAAAYPVWYGHEHLQPALLAQAAYGLPELFREPLRGAPLVAAAGCYVTASSLALAPFVRTGVVEPKGVIVDAYSGVSGAGRAAKPNLHFCTVDGDLTAYALISHRHTPEIEQATGAQVLFTPHLAPTSRGILATVYAQATHAGFSTADALEVLAAAFENEPFVVVSERSPSTKATLGSNVCQLTARVDPRTGWVVAVAALDNLGKGASGQALQCANLALGLDEVLGLSLAGVTP